MGPIENVNVFSNPGLGISATELITILQEVPAGVAIVPNAFHLDLVKDSAVVGRIELRNDLGLTGLQRLGLNI